MIAVFLTLCLDEVYAGKRAWTKAEVSSGLHSLGQEVVVRHSPPATLPSGALITRVLADRRFTGNADIRSSVCWNGLERCVDITGASVSTDAFKGLAANESIYLVHRAHTWRGARPPVFIKGNVTVWYETGEQADPN